MTHIPDEAVQAAICGYRGHATHDSALRSSLTAAYPHLPLGYEVKKLEWVEVSYGFIAHTPFGSYKISDEWKNRVALVCAGSDLPNSFFNLCVEAKAAAQADFERRVISCVVTKPVDVSAVRRQAFEEACTELEINWPHIAIPEMRDAIRAMSAEPAK